MGRVTDMGREALLKMVIDAAKKNPDLAKTLYLALKLAADGKR